MNYDSRFYIANIIMCCFGSLFFFLEEKDWRVNVFGLFILSVGFGFILLGPGDQDGDG